MPNYIRVKQIDPGEFTGAVNTVIESQSFKINVDTATGLVLNNVGGLSISGANIDLVDSSLSISGNLNVGGTIQGNINLAVANVVYVSGNQTISGVKTFTSRPTVNGTGVLLSGEILSNRIVYTTGNQIVSGDKRFANGIYITDTNNNLAGRITGIGGGGYMQFVSPQLIELIQENAGSQININNGIYINAADQLEYDGGDIYLYGAPNIYAEGSDAYFQNLNARNTLTLNSINTNDYYDQPKILLGNAGILKSTGPQAGLEYRSVLLGANITDSTNGADYTKVYSGTAAPFINFVAGPAQYGSRNGIYIGNVTGLNGNINKINHFMFIDMEETGNTYGSVKIGTGISNRNQISPIVSGYRLQVDGNLLAYNIVYNTGNQNISGIKNFISKPTVNGTGVLLSGDSASRVNYLTNTLTQTGTYYATSGYNNLYLKYNNTSTTEGITRVILPYESGSLGDILNIEWTNEGGAGGRTGDYFIMNRLVSDGSLSPNIPLKKDNYISFIRTPGGDNSGYAWHQVAANQTTINASLDYSRALFPTKENLYVTGQTISNLFTNTISDGLGRIDILSGQSVLIYGDQANISGRKSFQNLNYVRKTTAYNYVTGNFDFNNFYVNLINATSPRTGILPTPTSGLNYYVKNLNTGVVFLTGISGLKIDSADYLNLYKNESVELLGVNNLGYTGWITMSLNEGLT
jgi:hypothetical protein